MDRETLIATEFKVILPDTAPIYKLMHLSEAAHTQREARRKCIKDGLVWHG